MCMSSFFLSMRVPGCLRAPANLHVRVRMRVRSCVFACTRTRVCLRAFAHLRVFV